MLDCRTPPLLRARTCSIVLSACRGDELENVRTGADRLPDTFLPEFKAVFEQSCAVGRSEAAGFELQAEAKVRRAQVWMGWRSAGVDLSALAALAMQLDAEDIVSVVIGRGGSDGGRGQRLWEHLATFRDAMTELRRTGRLARRGHQVRSPSNHLNLPLSFISRTLLPLTSRKDWLTYFQDEIYSGCYTSAKL